ncbi:MAG TPA: hypothetical protein VHM28_03795 [Anaerolineales bacterium]|nr:hypothetical protein [Anaerolineales bacterium]
MARFKLIFIAVLFAAILQACGAAATPTQVDQTGTIVAETLQAFTPAATPVASPIPSPVASPSPSNSNLLPRSLYFLNNGNPSGDLQIFRLERDGKTVHQITFEPAAVGNFDISATDGSVVYMSNNQMLLVDANGAGRRVLVDGGAVTNENRLTNTVALPTWSPDGKTIAFAHNGLGFYSLDTGAINEVLTNQIDTSQGFPIVSAIYAPIKYSPDGTKLLINISYNEAGTMGIYDLGNNTLTKLNRPDGGLFCCTVAWTPDSAGVYGASPTLGIVDSGLLFANASSGEVSILIPGSAPDGTYNFADAPMVGPDGQLYLFFNNLTEIPTTNRPPLFMVRSASDGVTDRTQLRPDALKDANEILWAPDASFAIVAYPPAAGAYGGGVPYIEYPDGRTVSLGTDFAMLMKWGAPPVTP